MSNLTDPGPYDFFPLLAFDIKLPSLVGEGHYMLADFTVPNIVIPAYPRWSISPGSINYINSTDTTDFIISGFGAFSTIEFESDGPTVPSDCMFTGRCIASGHWDPVAAAEPSSAMLLLAGLVGLAAALRKRIRYLASAAHPRFG